MFLPLIEKRRSIRQFAAKQVEPEKVDVLVEAALRAPSAGGRSPWEFVVVTEHALMDKLSNAKKAGATFLKNARLAMVVCADPDKADTWIEDASIASIFIHLAAESIGLGSCWIQIRDRMHDDTRKAEEYVSDVLNIPRKLRVESIVAVGYPEEQKPPHKKEDLHYEKVYLNAYGKLYGR